MQENREDRIPKANEFYRHFKNKLYQINCIATHSETGEQLVIYQALYGDFKTYARPLEMFISKVDKDKYPDATQEYRFERISIEEYQAFENDFNQSFKTDDKVGVDVGKDKDEKEEKNDKQGNHLLLFLDAKSYSDKKAVLLHNKLKFTQNELDSIYMSLDIQKFGGNERQQVVSLVRYLDIQEQYEGARLRSW